MCPSTQKVTIAMHSSRNNREKGLLRLLCQLLYSSLTKSDVCFDQPNLNQLIVRIGHSFN